MTSQREAMAALEQYLLDGWRETGRELGRGSYAAVVEVEYKGLKCAGKKIYRTLCGKQGSGRFIERFEEECRLLSQLRHPHIVQFLGIYFDPDSNLPVLVMEFLPSTLTQCLDKYGILPEEINYGILGDVALGLRYLHERPQPIVHRDLSTNNVLLTSNMQGKISDLGVAKVLGLGTAQQSRMTQGPGTPPYMPPEVNVPIPQYDIRVDIFSYGVMIVHTLSSQWPLPGEAVRVNPNNPNDHMSISEVGRRQKYIDKIAADHPLMQLIHQCLSNSPASHPEASYVAEQVSAAASRTPPSFTNVVELMESIRVNARPPESLREENEKLSQGRGVSSLQEVQTLQLGESHQQVISSEAELQKQQVMVQEHCRTLLASNLKPSLFTPGAKLGWRKCADIPVAVAGAQATIVDGVVYVGGGDRMHPSQFLTLYTYDPRDDNWATLPPSPVLLPGVGQIAGQLVLVGGQIPLSKVTISRSVYTFARESQRWVSIIPDMPTPRMAPSVTSHSDILVACGGDSAPDTSTPVVELYSSEASQWFTCPPLPSPRRMMSSITIGNTLFLMGGWEKGIKASSTEKKTVFSISLSALKDRVIHCYSSSSDASKKQLWTTMKDVPHFFPTTGSIGGCLLTLGGRNVPQAQGPTFFVPRPRNPKRYTSVHAYNCHSSLWHEVGDLPMPLSNSTAALLPTDELLIIGGVDKGNEITNHVYKGTIEV